MYVTLFSVLLLVALGVAFAPFPYWPTYIRLWRAVLFEPGKWSAKKRQTIFLLKAGALSPVWTLLWYLDEWLYPTYRKGTISPVLIIGQPRCGTTLLHRSLAADDETFFAVRHVEWRYPFITIQKLIQRFGLGRRLESASYWPDSETGRRAAKMHPNNLSDWEEDGIFFEENFLHHFFTFLRFPYPSLLTHLGSYSELPKPAQEQMLDCHRKVLQKVLYLRGAQSGVYLSKEVTSHNKVPSVLRLYPDARFVVIVRTANQFMASLIELMRMSTMSKTGSDPATVPGWREAVVQRMRNDCRLLVTLCEDVIPKGSQYRLRSQTLMGEIDTAIRAIYMHLGLQVSEKFARHLRHLANVQKSRSRDYDYEPVDLDGFHEYDEFVRSFTSAPNPAPPRLPQPKLPTKIEWPATGAISK